MYSKSMRQDSDESSTEANKTVNTIPHKPLLKPASKPLVPNSIMNRKSSDSSWGSSSDASKKVKTSGTKPD